MKDEMSNSYIEENINNKTKEENIENEEVVNNNESEINNEVVETTEVPNNDLNTNENKPKKSKGIIFVILFVIIIALVGGAYYYINVIGKQNKTNGNETTTTVSDCEGDVCTTSSIFSSSSTTSSTTSADKEFRDYLSKLSKSFNSFEGKDLLGNKYYEIDLEEGTRCTGNNDVSFSFKDHNISYKCISDESYGDIVYVAKGTIDKVNVTTGYDNNTYISCGNIDFYGSDKDVIIYHVGNCDSMYYLDSSISFYSKDGNLNKEISTLTFEFKYKNLKYHIHSYIDGNYLYYVNSNNIKPSYDEEYNYELHKLDLITFEDTLIYSFSGKLIG